MSIALGVGLTSACTFSCRHCYSGGGANPVEMDTGVLFQLVDSLDVDSINLGTGESCLHPEFHPVIEMFHKLSIPVALTTAGPSVEALSDLELSRLHDVDFSLDFPEPVLHDRWRAAGAFDMVLRGIERCRSLGVTASVAMCLMDQNSSSMGKMCQLCAELGVSLRVNVYKPISNSRYQPEYSSFWNAVDTLFSCSASAVSSEPIVNAALALKTGSSQFKTAGSPCGIHSLRLRPGGEILPCVYWNSSQVTMENFLSGEMDLPGGCLTALPEFCRNCPAVSVCMGGCSGRRLYTGSALPDIYCFRTGDRKLPDIAVPAVLDGDSYIHSSYLCTMIAEFD